MIINDLFFSIAVAALLSVMVAALIRGEGVRKGVFWVFLTIFLASWAGGIWGNQLSSVFRGVPWLSHLFAGLLAVSLLLIFMPKHPDIGRETQLDREETRQLLDQVEKTREMEKIAYVAVDLFLGFILFLLIAAILLRYFRQG